MNKILWLFVSVILLMVISFWPINTSKDNSLVVFGKVELVSEGGYKDANFRLQGKKEMYYINRALVKHFTLDELKQLEGRWIRVCYAYHWSIFNMLFTPGRHITELQLNKQVLYSEFN